MGETGGTQDDLSGASGPNRRALLKGAVAAGVGAAAWTAPDIKTLGFTPAYAQTCTNPGTPVTLNETSTANVNCSCADGLGWLGNGTTTRNISGSGFSGSMELTGGFSDNCSDKLQPVAITASTSGGDTLNCRLIGVIVEVVNNTTFLPAPGALPIIVEGAPAPASLCGQSDYVDCSGPTPVWERINGNICSSQWRVVIECVDEGQCFP